MLELLGGPSDGRAVENELVLALGFEQFELIKQLLKNRLKVVWGTRLSRAQDDHERARMESEMAANPEAASILQALRATRTSARDRQSAMERNIRSVLGAAGLGAPGHVLPPHAGPLLCLVQRRQPRGPPPPARQCPDPVRREEARRLREGGGAGGVIADDDDVPAAPSGSARATGGVAKEVAARQVSVRRGRERKLEERRGGVCACSPDVPPGPPPACLVRACRWWTLSR